MKTEEKSPSLWIGRRTAFVLLAPFHDGDHVLVRSQETVDVGEIGIFVINGDAYIKKLGKGKLISLNEKYKPIPLRNDDSIHCCGKVLGVVEE